MVMVMMRSCRSFPLPIRRRRRRRQRYRLRRSLWISLKTKTVTDQVKSTAGAYSIVIILILIVVAGATSHRHCNLIGIFMNLWFEFRFWHWKECDFWIGRKWQMANSSSRNLFILFCFTQLYSVISLFIC